MRNVTTFTKFLDNDPVVIELDDVSSYKEAFKRLKVIPARALKSKNIAILRKYVDSETFQPAILFGIFTTDSYGFKELTSPYYYTLVQTILDSVGKS